MRLPMSDRGVRLNLRETCSIAEAPRMYEAMSLLGEVAATARVVQAARAPARLVAGHARPSARRADRVDPAGRRSCRPAERVPGRPAVVPRRSARPRRSLILDQEELRQLDKNAPVEQRELPAPAMAPPRPYGSLGAGEQAWRHALRQGALAGRDDITRGCRSSSGRGLIPDSGGD